MRKDGFRERVSKGEVRDWGALAERAKVYLIAGAWQSAHDLLWPYLIPHLMSRCGLVHIIECLCLQMAACSKLGHSEHLAKVREALDRSLSGDGALSAEASVLVAHCLAQKDMDNGRSVAARERIERVPKETVMQASSWARARRALLLGRIDFAVGDLDAAERHSLDASYLAAAANSEGLQGDALSGLAIVAQFKGALVEASALYAKAATHYWQAGNLAGHATVLLNRASVLGQMGLLSEAVRLFSESLDAATSLNRQATALRARLGLGWVSARRGDLKAARAWLLPAWRDARRLRVPREEGLALEYLSEMHLLAGAPEKARVALRLGKRLAERLAPEGDLALELRIREAMLSLADDRPRKAISQAREAIEHAKRVGMPWEHAQACRVLGIAYLRISRKPEAVTTFRTAQRLLEGMDEQLERRIVQAWLKALERPRRPRSRRTGEARGHGGALEARGHGGALRSTDPEGVHSDSMSSDRFLSDEFLIGLGDADVRKQRGTALSTLRFWLNHPLLGPRPWLQRKRKRDARSSSGAASRCAALAQSEGGVSPEAPVESEAASGVAAPCPPPSRSRSDVHPIWAELGLVTRSPAVLRTLDDAATYAPGMIPVLILGETGTGKDLLAQGIHALSGRAGCLVPVNCAAARKDLFVAELFGARRGAYTGAIEHRRGLIEEAEGGTLFFDEIADLEPEAQGFILRFLDTGEVRPLGETKSRCVEVRTVAATCRDLARHVKAGMFRADLYGRLAGLVLQIPPLRERREDIELLTALLWQREEGSLAGHQEIFNVQVHEKLKQRFWAGNVRELKHVVSRAVLFSRNRGPRAARAGLLQDEERHGVPDAGPACPRAVSVDRKPLKPRGRLKTDWDPDLLRDALETAGGYIPEAARLLGLSRSHAYRLYGDLKSRGQHRITEAGE